LHTRLQSGKLFEVPSARSSYILSHYSADEGGMAGCSLGRDFVPDE